LLYRKTAGNLTEFAGIVALGASPLWIMAIASDVLGGTKVILNEVVAELKVKEVIDPHASFTSVENLLSYLEKNTGNVADTIDLPPVTLGQMRETYDRLTSGLIELPKLNQVEQKYTELQQISQESKKSVFQIAALITAGASQAGVNMFQKHVWDYYAQTIDTIWKRGLFGYIQKTFHPYWKAVVNNFKPEKTSLTEHLIAKFSPKKNV
jgi:hypothetical protein